jgi:uncharacterized protein (TIGR03083 family)
MENSRFLECLAADYGRIRAAVPGHLDARVPTCPDWTVRDLTQHVGAVYLHKATTLRDGKQPTDWPPPGINDEDPVALLDRAYAEMIEQLTTRNPEDTSETWYPPDQTVGFWIRRMAQESVIHRIDAELGAAAPVAAIPDDLAIDGIDELLKVFVASNMIKWPEDLTEALAGSPGHTYKITTEGTTADAISWLVETSPASLTVKGGPDDPAPADATADVTITGTPTAVLRWAWNRETPAQLSDVTIKGDTKALAELRQCVVLSTQ